MGGAQGEYFAAQRARQTFELDFTEATLHFDPIRLRQIGRRFQHAAGKVAVVGEEDDAAGRVVETAYWKYAFGDTDEQIANGATPFGVGERRNNLRWLVEEHIGARLRNVSGLASGFDPVMLGVGLDAEFGDNYAVDADLTAKDHVLGVTPRGDSCA